MSACPNCGSHNYNPKDNCPKCGYLPSADVKLEEANLIFCSGCGCHYLIVNSPPCVHDKSHWQKVKL